MIDADYSTDPAFLDEAESCDPIVAAIRSAMSAQNARNARERAELARMEREGADPEALRRQRARVARMRDVDPHDLEEDTTP